MEKNTFEKGKYRILSLKGYQVYDRMHPLDGRPAELSVRDERGNVDFTRFEGFLDFSLETRKLREVYAKHRDALRERFEMKSPFEDFATMAVISLSFEGAYNKYHPKKGRQGCVFVHHGYFVDFEKDLVDHVCIREVNGVPLAVAVEVPYGEEDTQGARVYAPVENRVDDAVLPGFLAYDPARQAYVRRCNAQSGRMIGIPGVKTKAELRRELYESGFDCDGVHYVRYKRSAGSSRVGNCLFIAEPLYREMMEWSACGLDADTASDRAAWEAYTALTLSSIENIIKIPKKAILLLPDVKSVFREERVVCVDLAEKDGRQCKENASLVASERSCEIENTIWDGEALLDESVFEENGYAQKGMLLLRNRFFKTCAFHTRLQKWFADQGITQLRQLNGYTCGARSVSDIKLVITESSLKYLKMYRGEGTREERIRAAFAQWAENLENGFGVVKTDKKTAHMYGRMVCTNYQMINTIPLSQQEVLELITPSMEYLEKILRDPVYMRHYIHYLLREEQGEEAYDHPFYQDLSEEGEDSGIDEALLSYRKKMVLAMMSKTDEFSRTAFYSDFRKDIKKAFVKKLQLGRLLVNGTYATLFGNGAELLHATTDKEYTKHPPYPIALSGAEIDSSRFPDGAKLLGVRSPHVTMGNLYLGTNCRKEIYRQYFRLTEEIVCVNAIENNIQYRLNGCDYDSDTMLLTDEPIFLKKASEHYETHAVPYCAVSPSGSADFSNTPAGLAALDGTIANNFIGQIINLSQYYNSIYWDQFFRKGKQDTALYRDICKLAVMSGMEIDKAKRIYPVDAEAELSALGARKSAHRKVNEDPLFYRFVTKGVLHKGEEPLLHCPMEYLFCEVRKCVKRSPRQRMLLPLGALLPDRELAGGNNDSKYKAEILEIVSEAQRNLNRIQQYMRFDSKEDAAVGREKMAGIIKKCIDDVSRKVKTPRVIRLLVRELDKPQNLASSCRSLLLACLCFSKTHNFYHMVEAARDREMCDLVQDDLGEENIYGIAHKRVVKRLRHT